MDSYFLEPVALIVFRLAQIIHTDHEQVQIMTLRKHFVCEHLITTTGIIFSS